MNLGEAEALRLAVGLLEERLRQLPGAGVHGADLLVLAAADALGPSAFPTAIGDRLGMRRSNVSVIARDLARRGLLIPVDEADGGDGRRRPFRLTEQGAAALHAQEHARDEWLVKNGTAQLTAGEARQLADAVPLLLRLALT